MLAEHVWGIDFDPRATSSTSTSDTCAVRSICPGEARLLHTSEGCRLRRCGSSRESPAWARWPRPRAADALVRRRPPGDPSPYSARCPTPRFAGRFMQDVDSTLLVVAQVVRDTGYPRGPALSIRRPAPRAPRPRFLRQVPPAPRPRRRARARGSGDRPARVPFSLSADARATPARGRPTFETLGRRRSEPVRAPHHARDAAAGAWSI